MSRNGWGVGQSERWRGEISGHLRRSRLTEKLTNMFSVHIDTLAGQAEVIPTVGIGNVETEVGIEPE